MTDIIARAEFALTTDVAYKSATAYQSFLLVSELIAELKTARAEIERIKKSYENEKLFP